MSLFGSIPATRGCADAGIDPHWCACLNWAPLNTNTTLARSAGDFLLAHILSFTSDQGIRGLCVPLTLDTIARAAVMAPNKGREMVQKKKINYNFDIIVRCVEVQKVSWSRC